MKPAVSLIHTAQLAKPTAGATSPMANIRSWVRTFPNGQRLYLGKEITPQEFLDSPDAQEQIARGQGGKYLAKYGPIGAAEAWFAGERGRVEGRNTRKDTLGTHIDEYVRRFNHPLVTRDQVAASAMNAPAAMPAPDPVSDPSVAAESPQPEPPPVQLPGQVAALDTGTVSDAAPATADPRVGVVNSLVAQQQPAPPPPQQVAQVGGALPAVPPTMPIVPPTAIPKAPATPAQPVEPGPEPKLRDFIEGDERLKRQMDAAREVARDPKYRDDLRIQAQRQYEELEKRANDAYGKQWTVWHERTKEKEKFKLTEEEKSVQTTKLRGEAEDAAEERIQRQRFGMDPKEWHKNFKTEQNSAEVAGRMMADNQLIIRAVKDGVIMGTGAGWRLNVTKLAAWAAQNGYASELAANSEIARALSGSRIREAMSQINPSGPASNVDLLISKQLSGTDPVMEPKSFMTLLHKSNEFNAKVLNDFEDKRDYFLSGTRAERNYQINTSPTAPKEYVDALLQNRDDKAARAAYNERFGDGTAQLEIERFKRRTRRGQ